MASRKQEKCARVCQRCARGVPEELITLIRLQPSISREDLSKKLGISVRQVRKHIDFLRKKGILTREGGDSGQ